MAVEIMKCEQLARNLRHLSERYEKLHQVFAEFCSISSWLTTGNSPVPSIKHLPDPANNRLDIHLCGRTFRFEFALQLPDGAGKVTCYLVGLNPNEDAITVGAFTFLGTGDTKLKSADTGDILNIRTESGAAYLILQFAYDGLAKTAPA